MTSAFQHRIDTVELRGTETTFQAKQLRVAENAVQRCAKLMRYAGQETRFRLACLFGPAKRVGEMVSSCSLDAWMSVLSRASAALS